MTFPLCENCGKPATHIYTLDGGGEAPTCGHCVRGDVVSARPVGAEPPTVEALPLTVDAAAARENVSTRTIRRWLPELAASGGAWRAGAHWRIDPDALDARRATPRPRKPERKQPRRSRRRAKPTTTTASEGTWQA